MGKKKRLSWEDLSQKDFPVVITLPDGTEGEVVLRSVSEEEQEEIRASIEWPVAPLEFVKDRSGRPQRVPNVNDPKYAEIKRVSDREFTYRLLLGSLVDPAPPGGTVEEQTGKLKRDLGFWAWKTLLDKVMEINGLSEAEVETARSNFPELTF